LIELRVAELGHPYQAPLREAARINADQLAARAPVGAVRARAS